jgi:spore maturation protein CgeB
MRFVVAGPQYPAEIRWPDNDERIDHLSPPDHPSFYSRQRFTLNVTRADMKAAGWSPSVRLFEAAACATPVISDYWRGLEELLPDGEAAMIASDSDEVVKILEHVSEDERKQIGRAARKRIAAQHDGVARSNELLAVLEGIPPHSNRSLPELQRACV